MQESRFPAYCYGVDDADNLSRVDDSWLAFAHENGAPELTRSAIVGRCLWDFIADEGTQRLYEQLHRRVRSTSQPIVLPLRCDSPNLKRDIQLTISPDDAGALSYRSVILRVELQPQLALLTPTAKRTHDRLTMCSFCKKVCVEPMGWVNLERVAAKLHLFEGISAPRLFYEVSAECSTATADAAHDRAS